MKAIAKVAVSVSPVASRETEHDRGRESLASTVLPHRGPTRNRKNR
jgi:hypothetical protein